jgi:hypothetical protein
VVPQGQLTAGTDPDEIRFGEHATSSAFDAQGEALLLASDPGDYAVTWVLERKQPGGTSAREIHDLTQSLVVLEGTDERVLVLDLPAHVANIDWSKIDE